jgi:16S rRNA (guanine527-N7)-methyltransferase
LKREFGKGIGSSVEQNENDSMENQDETASESPVNELGLDAGEPASPTLAIAIEKLGLELPSEAPATALEQLEEYCRRLWDWNEKINLTRHTNFDLFARRDLLDACKLAKLLEPGEDILDVGSGGGVPGIVVAILRPDVQVSLCDSVGKKAKVLDDIVERMKLPIPVHALRVQAVLEDYRYSSLVARAVGPLEKLCDWLKNDWHNFDRLLALKGPKWIEERGAARHRGLLKGIELRRLVSYPMPGTESESVILQLRRLKPGEKEISQD